MDNAYGSHGRGENCMEYLVRKIEENNQVEVFTVDGKTILKMMLQNAMTWTEFIWFMLETGGGIL
jgi:hypothetical protein